MTKTTGSLRPPASDRRRQVGGGAADASLSEAEVIATRDHKEIRRWADARDAEPATGEMSKSGPATVSVNDGGAGIRFNFPGVSAFRPITWDEWFENFDRNHLVFLYEKDTDEGPSNRYRIVQGENRGLLRKVIDRFRARSD